MKEGNQILIIFGILAAIVLFTQTTFFGSFVNNCVNYEPENFDQFILSIDNLNGSINQNDFFQIQTLNNIEEYEKYQVSSSIGNFEIIKLNGSCADFLNYVKDNDDLTKETMELNNKNILLYKNQSYLWCNNADNLALLTEATETFNNYYTNYEVCSVIEINDSFNQLEDSCVNLRGEYLNNTCICADNENIGDRIICPDPEEYNESGDYIGNEDIGNDIPNNNDEDNTDYSFENETNNNETNYGYQSSSVKDYLESHTFIKWLIIITVILIIYYFGFEKGPNKGLFKSKKNYKRKRKKK